MTEELIDGLAIQYLAMKRRGYVGTFEGWLVARGHLEPRVPEIRKLVVLTEEVREACDAA